MDNKMSLKNNLIYNTIGSCFYLACQWLTTIVIVRIGNYEMAGNLSIALSITNVFVAIANFGMRNYQVSDVNEKYTASIYVSLRYVTCVIAMILCVIFVTVNGHYTITQQLVIILYMVFRLSEAISDVFQGIQQKASRMDYTGKSFLMRGAVSIVLFTLGLLISQNLVVAILMMAFGVFVVIYIYDYPICNRIQPIKLGLSKKVNDGIRECFPLMLTLVFSTSFVLIPRFELEKLCGSQALGYYASVATPAVIVQAFCTMIYTPLTSVLAEYYENKDRKGYRNMMLRSLGAMLLVSVAAIGAAAFLGKWGLTILFGKEIQKYSYLLVPVIITTIQMAFIYFYAMILTIARKLVSILISSLLSVIIILVLSTELIKRYNMQGVNYVLQIGLGINLVMLIVIWIFDWKKKFSSERMDEGK